MTNRNNELAALRSDVSELRAEVQTLTEETRALVEAWKTATGVVKFVKWLSTFMAAVGSLWLVFRFGFGKHG